MTSDSETSSCEGDEENEATDLQPPKRESLQNLDILRKVEKRKEKLRSMQALLERLLFTHAQPVNGRMNAVVIMTLVLLVQVNLVYRSTKNRYWNLIILSKKW